VAVRASAEHENEQAAAPAERSVSPHAQSPLGSPALVASLQRAAGNRAVAHLLSGPRVAGPTLARVFLPWTPPILLDPLALLSLGLSERNAPTELTLPAELETGLKKAWDKSLPGKKSLEQGGILVLTSGGYKWKPGKPGTSGTFRPNYGDVKKGESLTVVAHTHPYSKKEGGHTNVSFSGGDLASFVTDPDPIQVVRSGEGIFVAARTQEFNALLTGLSSAKKRKLRDEIEKFYDGVLASASGKLPERSDTAAQATCLRYHLVYYKGTAGGTLKQPEAMISARKLISFFGEDVWPAVQSLLK
jgi:hypothetical protein